MQRLNLLATGFCALLLASTVAAQIQPGSIEVELRTVIQWNPQQNPGAPNFEQTPTNMCPLNDGTNRILIPTLAGTIRVAIRNGDAFALLPQPLLNSNQVGFQLQTETGMTAIAVHPNFAGDPTEFGYGKLYTTTSENAAVNGGLSDPDIDFFFAFEVHQDIIREWDVSAIVGNLSVNSLPGISVDDSRELLRIDQPGPFHNLYDIGFDPTANPGDSNYGELFISLGDGGSSGSNDSNYSSQILQPQDLSTIYGNILRINPNPNAHSLVRTVTNTTAPNAGQPSYSISNENPFDGDDAVEDRMADSLAEIYAYGIRSPYRFNFDSQTGDLYYGDVGEISREEVTKIGIGQNGGWGRFEGTQVTNGSVNLTGPAPHTPPVLEYTASDGRTVVGGIVYRGNRIPELQGKYVFADFGASRETARLMYGIVDPSDPEFGSIFDLQLSPSGDTFAVDTNGDTNPDTTRLLPDRIFSVEELPDGELILIAGQDPRPQGPSAPGAYIILVTTDVLHGDVNGDGLINLLDVAPFIDLLSSGQYQLEADINKDGQVNLLDVGPFIDLL